MIELNISEEEKEILKKHFAKSPIELIRLKAEAILLSQKQMGLEDIADLVSRDGRTTRRWIHDFSQHRLSSLFSGLAENENASKLTRDQKQQIQETLQKPPSDYGLPKAFWDVPTLKNYIRAEFGVVYESVQSYHFLLKFSKLSYKYPDKFDVRRNEIAIQSRMTQIRQEVARYLADPNWEVFCSDETRLILEALTRKAWLKRGVKTVVKVERSREFQNYLGMLNLRTYRCETYPIAWGRQQEIIKAVKRHIDKYPEKRICTIWDNAKCHKGELLRKELGREGLLSRVYLINLPPYAPDMNPVEHVWEWGKNQIVNTQFETFDKTKAAFIAHLNSRAFHYQL